MNYFQQEKLQEAGHFANLSAICTLTDEIASRHGIQRENNGVVNNDMRKVAGEAVQVFLDAQDYEEGDQRFTFTESKKDDFDLNVSIFSLLKGANKLHTHIYI